MSSTWRLGKTRYGYSLKDHHKYLAGKLEKQNLQIFDVTPDLSRDGESRGREIHEWLNKHKDLKIDNWIVLDDEFFYDFTTYGINKHLVQTHYYIESGGLNDEATQEAIKLLTGGVKDDIG